MSALSGSTSLADAPVLAKLLSRIVLDNLEGATAGHCVRVNHLDQALAQDVLDQMAKGHAIPNLTVKLLDSTSSGNDDSRVTADRAIEIRNRKDGVFCLFVPASQHDSTASSLGNSFAEINGPELVEIAYHRFIHELASDRVSDAASAVRRVFDTVGSAARPAMIDRLQFAIAAQARDSNGDGDRMGLELWRVGRIPDPRPDFEVDLRRNRQAVGEITRPARLMASVDEKVSKLGLVPSSAATVSRILRGLNHHNPKSWCNALLDIPGGTFDKWTPLENVVPSNCNEVSVIPFRTEGGEVSPKVKGLKVDAPGGALFAEVGDKLKLRVGWSTDPKNTTVSKWLLEIVPAAEHADWDDLAIELPSAEFKKGTQRTGALSLDLGLTSDDELPRNAFQVKVSALSGSGETLVNSDEVELTALSDEFYFRAKEIGPEPLPHERNRTANTLAEGMLRAVALHGAQLDEIGSPAWTPGTPAISFTMRATPRETIRISFNALLDQLQAKTLEHPNALGLWRLRQDDATAAAIDGITGTVSPTSGSSAEDRYLRARKAFFSLVLDQPIRNRIEVVDWSAEIVDAALTHARAWVKWLDAASGDDLLVARSVDTLDVRIGSNDHPMMAARLVLPTHPLRALWFANHASLLSTWMRRLEEIDSPKRKRSVELDALANVTPTNVPPLLHHMDPDQPYVFYRNLDAGFGVAFPAETDNPGEQFVLLGAVLGYAGLNPLSDGRQPQRAALTTQRFHQAHPYADPFKLALINPDDGTFSGQMIQQWEAELNREQRGDPGQDDLDPVRLPGLFITSYTREQNGAQSLRGLAVRRQAEDARATIKASDHLRPSLSLVETGIAQLARRASDSAFSNQHHLALVQDVSTPEPVGQTTEFLPDSGSGLGLHGLVARFSTLHQRHNDTVHWLHWIDTSRPVTPHPVDKRLSDGMLDTHRAAGSASGRLINPSLSDPGATFSAIGVYLQKHDIEMLRLVHQHADWVLIVDRFFGAELFDTPRDTILGSDHRTYILDASPDYQDGMGHRSLVTTSSRDEVEAILARAMGKIGFDRLNESVGSLIQTLKMVSGRLVLDALQTDARAREVVALGAVVTWLNANGRLKDTIIIPVDSHLDLFRPGVSDVNEDQKRCDLALFRFVQNRLTITLVEVKSRSSLGDLDNLVDHMVAQMDATSSVLDHRYFNDDLRIDGVLQRSLLAHVLRFYLDRAERYALLGSPAASLLRKKIDLLETGNIQVNLQQQGFILALGEQPARKKFTVGDRSEIQILTIAEIAQGAQGDPGTTRDGEPEEPNGGDDSVVLEVDPGKHLPVETILAEAEDSPRPEDSSKEANLASSTAVPPILPVGSGAQPLSATNSESGFSPDSPGADGRLPEQDIVLGDANGSPVLWKPRTKGSPHLFILGIPGQGKTVTTERILIELAKSQTPALVLDFHGTLADPNGSYVRAANPAVLDASNGLPFSPFEIDPRSSWMQVQNHAKEISDVVDHVFGLGPIQSDVVFTTIRDLYKRRGFSDVDDDAPLPDPPTFADVSKALNKRAKDAGVKNVVARTRSLFDFDLFNPPSAGAPTFDDLLRQGVVIGLNRLGGDELGLALSAFLLRTIYLSMTNWPPADRIKLVIVLDEAHKLARDITLPKIMKEGRKYGVAVVVASQGLADFHADVVGNAGTKVSFRINNPDSKKVSQFFTARAGQDLVDTLERLVPAQALVQTSEMPHAIRVNMRNVEG